MQGSMIVTVCLFLSLMFVTSHQHHAKSAHNQRVNQQVIRQNTNVQQAQKVIRPNTNVQQAQQVIRPNKNVHQAQQVIRPNTIVQQAKPVACAVPAIYRPVCGSDEQTYVNWGALECAKKRGNPDLVKVHDGGCMYKAGYFDENLRRIVKKPGLSGKYN